MTLFRHDPLDPEWLARMEQARRLQAAEDARPVTKPEMAAAVVGLTFALVCVLAAAWWFLTEVLGLRWT